MPEIVGMCFNSWLRNNPTWEVVFLDDNNLHTYIDFKSELDLNREEIPLQAQSDIIRINLLKKYGGVWVDATCYCAKPLDSWLPNNLESGFFAFNRPNTDRMISSWFLAAVPNNELIRSYCNATNSFWQNSPPSKLVTKKGKKSLTQYFFFKALSSRPAYWHNSAVKNWVGFSNYFWFHYLFEHLYTSDSIFKSIWDKTPKVSANIPHTLLHYGYSKAASEEIKNEIRNPTAPFFKLNWRIPIHQNSGSTLSTLVNEDKIIRDRQI